MSAKAKKSAPKKAAPPKQKHAAARLDGNGQPTSAMRVVASRLRRKMGSLSRDEMRWLRKYDVDFPSGAKRRAWSPPDDIEPAESFDILKRPRVGRPPKHKPITREPEQLAPKLAPKPNPWKEIEREREARAPTIAPPAAPELAPALPPEPAEKPTEPTSSSTPAERFRVLDFGAPPGTPEGGADPHESAPPGAPLGSCTIANCPKCAALESSQICGTTGERVWPRMTADGARGFAGGLLNLVAFIARLFGRDITPTQAEVDQLGNAIATTAYRRASYMSAGDDLFALGFALAAFAMRVHHAPQTKRAPVPLAAVPRAS